MKYLLFFLLASVISGFQISRNFFEVKSVSNFTETVEDLFPKAEIEISLINLTSFPIDLSLADCSGSIIYTKFPSSGGWSGYFPVQTQGKCYFSIGHQKEEILWYRRPGWNTEFYGITSDSTLYFPWIVIRNSGEVIFLFFTSGQNN